MGSIPVGGTNENRKMEDEYNENDFKKYRDHFCHDGKFELGRIISELYRLRKKVEELASERGGSYW